MEITIPMAILGLVVSVVMGAFSGVISGAIVVSGMRTDIAWLKSAVKRAHERIDKVEARCIQRADCGHIRNS